MQILDEDMQMVRAWLKKANAPFHITEHFENLVAEHAKEADRVEELEEEVRSLEEGEQEELDKLQDKINDLEQNQDDADEMRVVLESVKYWLHAARHFAASGGCNSMSISIPMWVFPCLLLIILLFSGRLTPFPRFHYHARYAIHLWRNVPGMTFIEAWRYPFDADIADGDPIEDADAEITEMRI